MVKLLQLNIWQGRLILNILDFLQREQPDILCLQEVLSANKKIEIPNNMCNSFELIRKQLGYEYAFFSADLRTTLADAELAFGNAIISKYPLHDTQTHWIHGEPMQDQTSSNFIPQTCNLQRALVRLPHNKTVSIVNHHGYWVPSPEGSAVSKQKFQKVADIVAEIPRPLLLTGDLNVTHKSPALAPLEAQLRDLTYEEGLRTTLTSLNRTHSVACDHVMVSEEIHVHDLVASDELLSDHRALLLTFDV